MGDWNLNFIKKGDLLKGKMTVETLGKKFGDFTKKSFTYVILDSSLNTLKKVENQELKNEEITVVY